MDDFKKRVSNLLTVKSIVTLILTGVFAYLAITHQIEQNFMTVYTVVVAFYFGTQANKDPGTGTAPDATMEGPTNIYNYYDPANMPGQGGGGDD